MRRLRALLLAEPDRDHLEQAAFDGAAKRGMRLDAIDDDDGVGLGGKLVDVDGQPVVELGQLHDLHRRADRRPDRLFGNAEMRKDFRLAFRCRTAVAAHRRHDERSPAGLLNRVDCHLRQQGDIGDAPAADGNRDGIARPNPVDRARFFQLLGQRPRGIVQPRSVESLADAHHFRNRNVFEQLV